MLGFSTSTICESVSVAS